MLEPESQMPTPPGAAPIRTPGCEVTHCFLVSDPWSQDFLGLAAKRVLPDSLPTGYGDFTANTASSSLSHQHTVTNGKEC